MGKIDDMRRQREQQYADAQQRRAKVRPAEAGTPAAAAAATTPAAAAAPATAAGTAAAAAAPAAAAHHGRDEELAQPSRPTRPTGAKSKTSSKAGGAAAESGTCAGCGKTKPVSHGLVAQHQKGFGKACTGSRHPPR